MSSSCQSTSKYIRRAEYVLIITSFAALVWLYVPILTATKLVGWDLTPHYYLLYKAEQIVSNSRLIGYDPQWFGGYPLFTLYGIGPYIVALLPHWISCGFFSVDQSFHIFLGALPVVFLYFIYKLTRLLYGRVAGLLSLPVFLFYFFSSPEFFAYGYSAHSEIRMGLFGAQLGLLLLVCALISLERGARNKSLLQKVIFSTLIVAIGYTHILTFCFSIGIFTFLAAFRRYRTTLLMCAPMIGLLIAPLAIEWLTFIPFHSSRSISSFSTLDPFFALVPGLKNTSALELTSRSILNFFVQLGAVLLGILLASGLAHRSKRSHRAVPLLWLFVLGFVFVPREILTQLTPLPLHYYRFIPILVVLAMVHIASSVNFYYSKNNRLRRVAGSFIFISITFISFVQVFLFDWRTPFPVANQLTRSNPYNTYPLFRKDAELTENLDSLITHIRSLKPQGRIAVESTLEQMGRAGSPHALLSEIPLATGREILPGLVIESSMIGPVALFALSKGSQQMSWGAYGQSGRAELTNMTLTQMLARLSGLGVRYVIAASETYKNSLRTKLGSQITDEHTFGSYSIFDIGEPRPLVQSTNGLPWYFFSSERTTLAHMRLFRSFGLLWWASDELIDIPLITKPHPDSTAIFSSCNEISGFVVPTKSSAELNRALKRYQASCDKPIVVLNDSAPVDSIRSQTTRNLNSIEGEASADMFGVKIRHQGSALVRYGYSPNLIPNSGELYVAAPGFIYSMGSGARFLKFN